MSDLVLKVGVDFASQKYLQIQMLEVDILVLTLCQRTSGYHSPGTCAREESREGERERGREREAKTHPKVTSLFRVLQEAIHTHLSLSHGGTSHYHLFIWTEHTVSSGDKISQQISGY